MDGDTVTHWLDGLREGDSMAAQKLWDRYFARLIRVAHARLQSISPVREAEDVALSAMKSLMIGIEAGKFSDLNDESNLWPLLVTITARKSYGEMRRQLAQKRSVSSTEYLGSLRQVIGNEPSPDFAAEVADELERLVALSGEPMLATIAQRKLEGFSNEEIAQELDCSSKTIQRKLRRIRQEWEEGDENAFEDEAPSLP